MRTRTVCRWFVSLMWMIVVQEAQAFCNQSTGRWLSRDPIGELGFTILGGASFGDGSLGVPSELQGGANLYTFVANNPIDQLDGLGLAFYAIDGTWTKATDMANPWILYHWTKEIPRRYFRGPRDGPGGLDTGVIAVKVWKRVCTDYCAAKGNDFTVNLTGWSRGAVAAVQVAQLLNDVGCDCGCGWQKPIPVNWIGLLDAVKMTPVVLTKTVPPNVAHFYHAVKTSTAQWYFPTLHYTGGGTEHKVYNYRAPYLTSHSDVGESVIKGGINDAYTWIEGTAVASGVKF